MMKARTLTAAAVLAIGLSAGPAAAVAAQPPATAFTLGQMVTGPRVPVLTPPNAQWCVDLSAVYRGVYYVSNASGREITRMDLRTGKLLPPLRPPPDVRQFTGCAGAQRFVFRKEGPQGFTIAGHELWAGNGNSHVLRFALPSGRYLGSIDTGGTFRADEMATSGRTVLVTNPDDPAPFLTLISVRAHRVIRHLTIPGATSLEQPAWNGHRWDVSVPATTNRPGGEVAVLSAGGKLLRTIPVGNCGPSGLAINPRGGTMALGCQPGSPSLIMSLGGTVVNTLPAVEGVDEVWWDASAGVWDFGNFVGQGCQVVAASGLPFGNIPAVGPGFHACASWGGRWLLPGSSGIAVWHRAG